LRWLVSVSAKSDANCTYLSCGEQCPVIAYIQARNRACSPHETLRVALWVVHDRHSASSKRNAAIFGTACSQGSPVNRAQAQSTLQGHLQTAQTVKEDLTEHVCRYA
jgi:hypothetical protein